MLHGTDHGCRSAPILAEEPVASVLPRHTGIGAAIGAVTVATTLVVADVMVRAVIRAATMPEPATIIPEEHTSVHR